MVAVADGEVLAPRRAADRGADERPAGRRGRRADARARGRLPAARLADRDPTMIFSFLSLGRDPGAAADEPRAGRRGHLRAGLAARRHMSLWLVALVIAGTVTAAVLGMLALRRVSPTGGHFRDSDRASGVFGFVGAGFAILLGFVILLTFETYNDRQGTSPRWRRRRRCSTSTRWLRCFQPAAQAGRPAGRPSCATRGRWWRTSGRRWSTAATESTGGPLDRPAGG